MPTIYVFPVWCKILFLKHEKIISSELAITLELKYNLSIFWILFVWCSTQISAGSAVCSLNHTSRHPWSEHSLTKDNKKIVSHTFTCTLTNKIWIINIPGTQNRSKYSGFGNSTHYWYKKIIKKINCFLDLLNLLKN